MLISGGHDETDWRVAFGARIEFRGAGGERRGGAHTGRGNCDCGEQSRGGGGGRERAGAGGRWAGYMRLLSPHFVAAFPQRILNIHPSLLPAFPGLESQRQALEHGAKFSGGTGHFVDENLDAGPIVLQACVAIEDADTPETLAARILREEHRIYTAAVRIVLEGRYRMEGRRVLLNALKGAGEKK